MTRLADELAGRVKELFFELSELDPAEREARLTALGDEDLIARVRGLLAADERAEGWVQSSVFPPVQVKHLQPLLKAGDEVGPYRLVEEIGEGGFGNVWIAEQEVPLRRRVAVKILKAGMDTREVVARFEAERQALALMDHPNIAHVFDGGATEFGRPYFAMELVTGAPITEVCANRELDTEQRLRLFLDVCRAVQHAHQKGVIHRDLKPSNVLVGEVDGKLIPKVIDFGIAKAIEAPLTERTIHTRGGVFLGTPVYMSPEQIHSGHDVDTRSDVYALGVLLYELLTGTTPFDERELRQAPISEIQRIILEVDPPRPSTRLVHLRKTGRSTMSDARLSRRLRGDLDWIVMRCLEKDRGRRYDSADVLANEIVRYLRGEPVLAGPPGLAYRAHKFVRRNITLLATAALMFFLLLSGVILSTTQAVRAGRAEQELAEEARQAGIELQKYEEIALFLQDVLMSIDPAVAQGQDRTLLRQVLDRAAKRVADLEAPQAEVEGVLRQTIGLSYFSIGFYEEALPELERAAQVFEEHLDADDPRLFEVWNDLGALELRLGRYEAAEDHIQRALDGRRRVLGPKDLATVETLSSYGTLRGRMGRIEEALEILLEVEELRIEHFGADRLETILVSNNIANIQVNLGQVEEATKRLETALAVQERELSEKHPNTIQAMSVLGSHYMALGRFQDAGPLLERALELKRQVLSEDHPSILFTFNNLAKMYEALRRYDDALRYFEEGLEHALSSVGGSHDSTSSIRVNLARLHRQRGNNDEAELVLTEMVDDVLAVDPPLTPAGLMAFMDLIDIQMAAGRLEEAVEFARLGVAHLEGYDRPSDPGPGILHIRLGQLLHEAGEEESVREELERGLELLEALPGNEQHRLRAEGLLQRLR